jgi:ferric-dicitrate binding protein FerR (iron transport regulator)
MNNPTPPDPNPDPDAALDELLRKALETTALDRAALDRINAATTREWRLATQRAPAPLVRARRLWIGALAAAGIAGLIVLGVVMRYGGEPAVVGTLSRLHAGSIEAHWAIVRHRALRVGDALRVGETIVAQAPALVSLAGGGTLRIAAGAAIEMSSKTRLTLQQGLIYMDTPLAMGTPPAAAGGELQLMTSAGLIEHLGTAYEVLSDGSTVRIRVREGKIRLVNAANAVIAVQGTELTAGSQGTVSRRDFNPYGADWAWVMSLAPEFNTDGRSLLEFLQWASRELGRQLEFADPRAQEIAGHTILHGYIRGDGVQESLSTVLQTTSLTYEIQAGAVRVHSSP